jgi:hypothetical protein
MANLSGLVTIVNDMFDVLDALITNMVDLMTGNLIVLVVVGAFITLIVGIIVLLLNYLKKAFGNAVPSTKMK